MITEEMLRRAAEASSQAFVERAERDYDPARAHSFPPEFEQKIRKLDKKTAHPWLRRASRQVASVLLAAALAGSMWLSVDVEARAAFFGWVRERVETFFVYRFEGTSAVPGAPRAYQLTWIPEGYSHWRTIETDRTISVLYTDDAGHFLKFDYVLNPDETTWFINVPNATEKKTFVHNYSADLLLSNDSNESSAVLWMDEYNTALCVSACLPEEELIRLAESVQKIF